MIEAGAKRCLPRGVHRSLGRLVTDHELVSSRHWKIELVMATERLEAIRTGVADLCSIFRIDDHSSDKWSCY